MKKKQSKLLSEIIAFFCFISVLFSPLDGDALPPGSYPGEGWYCIEATPESPQEFTFHVSGVSSLYSTATLTDPIGSESICGGFRSFNYGGMAILTIDLPAGWVKSTSCRGDASATSVGAVYSIDEVSFGICDFELIYNGNGGNITTIASDPLDHAQLFNFTGDLGNFTLDPGSEQENQITFENMPPLTYHVELVCSDASCDFSSITCEDPDGQTFSDSSSVFIDLDEGESVVCRFANHGPNPPLPVIQLLLK